MKISSIKFSSIKEALSAPPPAARKNLKKREDKKERHRAGNAERDEGVKNYNLKKLSKITR